jgi:hypothetical protein
VFTAAVLQGGSWEETQISLKDYDKSLMLRACNKVVQAVEWTRDGRLILEHSVPISTQPDLPLPMKEFMRLAIDIAEALAFVHDYNIVHNSIQPRYSL